jgi:hypothetical protein
MNLTPMTELDAVNLMMTVIGEAPVSSLSVSGLSEVAIAQQILNEVSRETQEKGWGFNTEDDYELAININGEIVVPPNVLRIDVEESEGLQLVQRGTRMYDKENKTYIFTESHKFQLTFMLDFEEIPQAARHYIAVRAARKFQKRMVGSQLLEQFTADDEMMALASLQDMDTDVEDYNILTRSPASIAILGR